MRLVILGLILSLVLGLVFVVRFYLVIIFIPFLRGLSSFLATLVTFARLAARFLAWLSIKALRPFFRLAFVLLAYTSI